MQIVFDASADTMGAAIGFTVDGLGFGLGAIRGEDDGAGETWVCFTYQTSQVQDELRYELGATVEDGHGDNRVVSTGEAAFQLGREDLLCGAEQLGGPAVRDSVEALWDTLVASSLRQLRGDDAE